MKGCKASQHVGHALEVEEFMNDTAESITISNWKKSRFQNLTFCGLSLVEPSQKKVVHLLCQTPTHQTSACAPKALSSLAASKARAASIGISRQRRRVRAQAVLARSKASKSSKPPKGRTFFAGGGGCCLGFAYKRLGRGRLHCLAMADCIPESFFQASCSHHIPQPL